MFRFSRLPTDLRFPPQLYTFQNAASLATGKQFLKVCKWKAGKSCKTYYIHLIYYRNA